MVDHGYVLPTRGLVLDSDGSGDQLTRAQGCATLARMAESIGFSSVWAGDSVLAKPRLDLLSGGRLSLGVGVGSGESVATEHEQLGVPYERRGRVLDETLDVVRGLWDGPLDEYNGDFVTLEDADIGLRPPGELPITSH